LLVYLHGIIPPSPSSRHKTKIQRIVANACRRANITAMIPRGVQGIGPAWHQNWWSWPTTEPAYRHRARRLIDRLEGARRTLETCTGHRFERVYVAGSSAGAYFVTLLALHGEMPADGYGAISGGGRFLASSLGGLPPKPFYIGYGTADSVAPGARSLAQLLRGYRWPVKLSPHPFGHGAREVYLEEALAFWRTETAGGRGVSRNEP
jgi:predicted esterase